ncbi:MAG: alpha/beta hydrolase, partial [Christensenellaceae bacterium]
MMKYRTKKIVVAAGDTKLKLLVLQPKARAEEGGRTGILWIHGGGYATGMAGMVHMSRAKGLVQKYGAVVVSPEYRLSGKHPYPAALCDCHAALLYLKEHAKELGVRSDQIMVGGESAGGGLAAALCMYEKDCGGVKIAFQMPLYPMLDCEDSETSKENHDPVWNTKRNHCAWKMYLRKIEGEVPCYASPSRRRDYAGLPPAYTFVCDREPFYAETASYIAHLSEAGVEAKMDVYPGLFHA